jgi:hypothetical protein
METCVRHAGNYYISVWGRKHEPYTEYANSLRPRKARQVKSKMKSMLMIFFYIKRIIHKGFVLESQAVNFK